MWPLKSQNKEHSTAITETISKADIDDFWVYWVKNPIYPWRGKIKYGKWEAKYEREFKASTFEETVRQMAEFSEKNLLIEIK